MGKVHIIAAIFPIFSCQALACEVQTNSAYKDKIFDNYVIPVSVGLNEKCIIIDFVDNDGTHPHRYLIRPVEKNSPKAKNQYGKFYREYKSNGNNELINQYIYQAGKIPGTEEIPFSAFPYGKEDRAISYLIIVK